MVPFFLNAIKIPLAFKRPGTLVAPGVGVLVFVLVYHAW